MLICPKKPMLVFVYFVSAPNITKEVEAFLASQTDRRLGQIVGRLVGKKAFIDPVHFSRSYASRLLRKKLDDEV